MIVRTPSARLFGATALLFGLGVLSLNCVVEDKDGGGDDDDDGAGASGAGGSGSGNNGSGASGNNGSGAGMPGTFECCLNGVGFACPSDAALDQCIGFDIDGCLAGCSFDDFECQDACFAQLDMSTPDPSACTQDASVTCDGNPGVCVGDWDGTNCDQDSDCSSLNCFDQKCYATDAGNPCEQDSDCSTLNCYESCCYDTGAGNPCEQDSDCSSLNCFENQCQ
jgi:hypothetical protein